MVSADWAEHVNLLLDSQKYLISVALALIVQGSINFILTEVDWIINLLVPGVQ